MDPLEDTNAQEEHLFHHYTGNAIPWFVRLIWVLFWVFAVYYAIRFALPMIQTELVSPP